MDSDSCLFVTGRGKSGTSTVLGILNTHPEICVLFEANFLASKGIAPRGEQFLKAWPQLAEKFQLAETLTQTYCQLGTQLEELGHSFRYFGDKVLLDELPPERRQELAKLRTIYIVRDLRTWLCKNVVVAHYDQPDGLARKAADYVDSFIQSFLWSDVLHLSMEALVTNCEGAIAQMGRFLQIDLQTSADGWWKKVAKTPAESPKGSVQWWIGHDSSSLKPKKLDTTAELKSHPLWEEILPIFDKYYQNLGQAFTREEVEADRATLAGLQPHKVQLEDLYETVSSVSFGSGFLGDLGHRSRNPHVKPLHIKN